MCVCVVPPGVVFVRNTVGWSKHSYQQLLTSLPYNTAVYVIRPRNSASAGRKRAPQLSLTWKCVCSPPFQRTGVHEVFMAGSGNLQQRRAKQENKSFQTQPTKSTSFPSLPADDIKTQTAVQPGRKRIVSERVCACVHVRPRVGLIPDDSLWTDRQKCT